MIAPFLLILTALLAVIGGWIVVRAIIGDRAKGRLRCPKCWYDMQGAPGLVCSECGHDAQDQANLTHTRRSRRVILLGLLMLAATWYPYEVAQRVQTDGESISTAVLPTTYGVLAYPYLTVVDRDWVAERLRRSRAQRSIAWEWQARLFARQAGNVFITHADDRQNRSAALRDLERITSRWNVASSVVVEMRRRVQFDPTESARADKIMGTIAQRCGDRQATRWLIDGLDDTPSDKGLQNLIYLSAASDVGWAQLDDGELDTMVRGMWGHPFTHMDSTLLDRALLAVVGRPKIAERTFQYMVDHPPELAEARMLPAVGALRRVQGRASPLQVQVMDEKIVWAKSPVAIHVRLRCVEQEKAESFRVRVGDGFTTGSNDGWRVSVRDAAGAEVPVVARPAVASSVADHFGAADGIESTLNLAEHVQRPAAGAYTMRVQFHDRLRIAGTSDLARHWLFQSDPIPLIVAPD